MTSCFICVCQQDALFVCEKDLLVHSKLSHFLDSKEVNHHTFFILPPFSALNPVKKAALLLIAQIR